MDEMNISFTTQELVTLVKILDIACKAGGLVVANEAIYFYNKFQNVYNAIPSKSSLEKDMDDFIKEASS